MTNFVDDEIDLDELQKAEMVTMYVNQMMLPQTISMYEQQMADGTISQEEALYNAVVNECVNIILNAEMARQKAQESTDVGEE